MTSEHVFNEVEARWAQVDESARVSSMAVVGAPGEWLGKPSIFPAIINAGVVVREFARVHAGCVRETVIGEDSLLLSGCYVAHDVRIGKQVHLAPNAVVGGLAEIGDYSRIGLNATVLPHRKIGRNCIIGAGSVVTKDIPDGQVWAGNPATYRKDTERAIPDEG